MKKTILTLALALAPLSMMAGEKVFTKERVQIDLNYTEGLTPPKGNDDSRIKIYTPLTLDFKDKVVFAKLKKKNSDKKPNLTYTISAQVIGEDLKFTVFKNDKEQVALQMIGTSGPSGSIDQEGRSLRIKIRR